MSSEDKTIDDYKIILIGNQGVGKTNFFRKLYTGKFYEKYIPSVGIDRIKYNFSSNLVDNGIVAEKNFGSILYDLSGNEKYKELNSKYFKDSDGIIIIYDITNRDSFDNIENWINCLKEKIPINNGKISIMLIGNKLDLIDFQKDKRQVTEEEARIYCQKNNIIWGGEKSCKDLSKDELLEIIKDFILQIYYLIGEKIVIVKKLAPIRNYHHPRHAPEKCLIF